MAQQNIDFTFKTPPSFEHQKDMQESNKISSENEWVHPSSYQQGPSQGSIPSPPPPPPVYKGSSSPQERARILMYEYTDKGKQYSHGDYSSYDEKPNFQQVEEIDHGRRTKQTSDDSTLKTNYQQDHEEEKYRRPRDTRYYQQYDDEQRKSSRTDDTQYEGTGRIQDVYIERRPVYFESNQDRNRYYDWHEGGDTTGQRRKEDIKQLAKEKTEEILPYEKRQVIKSEGRELINRLMQEIKEQKAKHREASYEPEPYRSDTRLRHDMEHAKEKLIGTVELVRGALKEIAGETSGNEQLKGQGAYEKRHAEKLMR